MNPKKLLSVLLLTLAACFSAPRAVRAGGSPPASPSPANPVPSTTGAAVRGSVRFEGKVPAGKVISMAADPVCAKQHPSAMMAQDVVTDTKGDLENVIVFVSEGLGDRTFDAPTQPVVVEQKGCMY